MGRKVESDAPVEVERAGDDDGERRRKRAEPQGNRDLADVRDALIEQQYVDNADYGGDECRLMRGDAGPDVARVLRKADVAGSDLKWAAQDELPDEEKRHKAAERLAPEGFAQVEIRAA